MGIHRARIVWATIALAGLTGCQSGGGNSLAFWKSNPLSSKTAAATSKPQYPPKPSTQVANPTEVKTPAASGLAAQPNSKTSTNFPGAVTSFTAPANTPTSSPSPSGAASLASQRGSPAATTANGLDPVVSPQRGYYSPPSTANTKPANNALSSGPGTAAASVATGRSDGPPTSGFRSGAKDYTSSPLDYTTSSTLSTANNGGAMVPRYGAAAERNSFSSTTNVPAYEPLATASRATPGYNATGSSYPSAPSAYGASVSGTATPGTRSGPTDPFQANNHSATAATTNNLPDRGYSPYTSPHASPAMSNANGADRNTPAYASNPFAAQAAPSTGASGSDRALSPNYRDYPSTDSSSSRLGNPYPSTGGNDFPGSDRSPAASNDFRAPTQSAGPSTDYRPGNTGYQPPASDYRPSDTGYRPASTSPYRGFNNARPQADEPPPFRPGSTSDYVPKSTSAGSSANTASREPFGPRNDSGVQSTGYTAGGPDYRR